MRTTIPRLDFDPFELETTDGHRVTVVAPQFRGPTICDVLPTAAELMSVEIPPIQVDIRPPLASSVRDIRQAAGPIDGVFIVLVDGLSVSMTNRIISAFGWPETKRSFPYSLSTIFPSQTEACLPAIWSCSPPSVSGQFGRFFYVPEINATAGPIFRQAGPLRLGDDREIVDATYSQAMAFRSWAPLMKSRGIDVKPFVTIGYRDFTKRLYQGFEPRIALAPETNTGRMRQIGSRGETYSAADIMLLKDAAETALATPAGQKQLCFLHLMAIQRAATVIRLSDDDFLEAIRDVWMCLIETIDAVTNRGNWIVAVVADHGTLEIESDESIFLPESAVDGIERLSYAPPASNARSFYFFPSGLRESREIEKIVSDCVPDGCCALIDLDDGMYAALFGGYSPNYARNRARPGQLVAVNVGRGNMSMWWDPPHSRLNHGSHGGLSREEMEVPLIILANDRV